MNFICRKFNKGFSFVEVLFYLAILSVLTMAVFNSLVTISNSFKETKVTNDLIHNSYIMERISREIRAAESLTYVDSSTLVLSSGSDSVKFIWEGNDLNLYENDILVGPMNNNSVLVSDLSFTRVSTLEKDAVKIFFEIEPISLESSGMCIDVNCAKSFYSTISLRGAITSSGSSASTYSLTVSASGAGTVTSNIGNIDCSPDCSDTYNAGETVSLSPSPSVGYTFSSWGGDCSGSGSCNMTMTEDKSVTATFVLDSTPTHKLSVYKTGDGWEYGSVDDDFGFISCGSGCNTDSANIDEGDIITLTATNFPGGIFIEWQGDCSGSGSCVLDMTTDKSVTAYFGLDK